MEKVLGINTVSGHEPHFLLDRECRSFNLHCSFIWLVYASSALLFPR